MEKKKPGHSEAMAEITAKAEAILKSPFARQIHSMVVNEARGALKAARCSALEFLAANPRVSNFELTKRLKERTNMRVRTIGLMKVIYAEAERLGAIRETAKDLLLREIEHAFPDGWSSSGEVGPLIKIGGWEDPIREDVQNPVLAGFARDIVKHLAVEHQPPEGWKPQPQNDPLIDELFDRYWPVDPALSSKQHGQNKRDAVDAAI